MHNMYTHPYGQCNIIYNSQELEATQVPWSKLLNMLRILDQEVVLMKTVG